MPDWGEFEPRERSGLDEASRTAAEDFDVLCAQVFMGGVGRDLLKALRGMTIERRVPPNAPEAVLREMEARRRLVQDLEQARDRGLKTIAERKKPTA